MQLVEQLEKLKSEKNSLEYKIIESNFEFKEALAKERMSSQIQNLLRDQIDVLKREKGLNRQGLNKDVQIAKMKNMIETMTEKKDEKGAMLAQVKAWVSDKLHELLEEMNLRFKTDT